MTISDLKLELIQLIIDTNDIDLLLKIKTILNQKENTELNDSTGSANEPTVHYEKTRVFSAEEQQKIDIALKQVENGDYISNEEAQIEIEKWFEDQEK